MPSDAIVTADDLTQARAQIRREGTAQIMDCLQQIEPELYEFVLNASHCVAGRLALFSVPQRPVRETADDLLETVLTCLLAMRQSHARLWEQDEDDRSIPF
ncbi:MAG TPA: hypothetical protein VIL86_16090 [Tepidisphaeraceae bacterium]|jgi:hypothetical protein